MVEPMSASPPTAEELRLKEADGCMSRFRVSIAVRMTTNTGDDGVGCASGKAHHFMSLNHDGCTGPYLSERQWGTVREDYTHNGDVWSSLSYEDAARRAYRWGEDGIGGISDNHGRVCLSFAFWNEKDPFLKERLFGLTGPEGNHGEDCKEMYYYLDSTPTHSYMKMLYKFPQNRFPYEELRRRNNLGNRTRAENEYELMDTGIFDRDEYFDVFIEYCKGDVDDMLCRVTVANRSDKAAPVHVLPTALFRNMWSWQQPRPSKPVAKPSISAQPRCISTVSSATLEDTSRSFRHYFHAAAIPGQPPPELLFTNNETNNQRLYGVPNVAPFVKDGINQRVVHGDTGAVDPARRGTKCSAWYRLIVPAKGEVVIKLRFTNLSGVGRFGLVGETATQGDLFSAASFDDLFSRRKIEADEFYGKLQPASLSDDLKNIQRQAYAGMLWSKQYYYYVVQRWMDGDPGQPVPPPDRKKSWARNYHWRHLHVDDVLSMPDKWEYPFFCAWDTAFHAIPLAQVDPWFAKRQLDRLTREWYMHPSGQMPAYEWAFSDVNPPVHAWATLRTYKIEKKYWGVTDTMFLERVFQKLLLNFTWWVNRKDREGNNVFEGGFLGLDNIAVFNRSEALPLNGRLRQADATGWMAFFSLYMLEIALELAQTNPTYEDIASKFFEHFLYISDALTFSTGEDGKVQSLWDEHDGFYYDAIQFHDGRVAPLKVRSMVGLIPLFAVVVLEPELLEKVPGFRRRMEWFLDNWDWTGRNVSFQWTNNDSSSCDDSTHPPSSRGKDFYKRRVLLSLVDRSRLTKILGKLLDPEEFLSERGIRSLSKYHRAHPYTWWTESGEAKTVAYLSGESDSGLFGGNSNWRGPVWLATTFLIIESLGRFHYFYGDEGFKVECPTGSGKMKDLKLVSEDIMHRTIRLFCRDLDGRRPYNGTDPAHDKLNFDPHFSDHVLFFEYFDGDSGRGLGASHQTGWTGLVAKLILTAGQTCEVSGRCMIEMRPPEVTKRLQERKKLREAERANASGPVANGGHT